MQSDWLRAFWPISREQDFSQIQDLCRNPTKNKQVQWKLLTNFLFKLKESLAHFPNFWAKNVFPKNQAVMQNFISVSSLWQNSEKSHDQIPRKHCDRCLEGRMDRTYFIGSFQLLPRGLTSTTAVDLVV